MLLYNKCFKTKLIKKGVSHLIAIILLFTSFFLYAVEKKITIIHTNDHHGQFMPDSSGNYGMVNRAIIIERIRKEVESDGGTVFVFDAGDINTGRPESDLLEGKPDITGMNMIGYDVMTVGNHEFDIPLESLKKQQSIAKFPFISANIYSQKDNKRLFKPYVFIEKNDVSLGVIGLTTTSTKSPTSKKLSDYDFRDHSYEFLKALDELRKEDKSPDLIVGLTHIGYYQGGSHGSNPPGDVTLANNLPTGSVDLIIGGHSHTAVCFIDGNMAEQADRNCLPDRVNDIWITQALSSGHYLGKIDFTIKENVAKLDNYQLIPITKQDTTEYSKNTEELQSIFSKYILETKELLGQPVAFLPMTLDGKREYVRNQQAEIAQVILAAQAKRVSADFSIMGGGSIRTSLNKGLITYADILAVQPFSNRVTYVDLNKSEVIDYINKVAFITSGSGGYPQFYNVTFDSDGSKVDNIRIAGKKLTSDSLYRLSMPDYNAHGGNNYPIVSDHPRFVDSGYIDAEVLKSYMSEIYPFKK